MCSAKPASPQGWWGWRYLTGEGQCQCLRAWQWSQASRNRRDLWGRCLDDRKQEAAVESDWVTLPAALHGCVPWTIRRSRGRLWQGCRALSSCPMAEEAAALKGRHVPESLHSPDLGIMLQWAETLPEEGHSCLWHFSIFNSISSAPGCFSRLELCQCCCDPCGVAGALGWLWAGWGQHSRGCATRDTGSVACGAVSFRTRETHGGFWQVFSSPNIYMNIFVIFSPGKEVYSPSVCFCEHSAML